MRAPLSVTGFVESGRGRGVEPRAVTLPRTPTALLPPLGGHLGRRVPDGAAPPLHRHGAQPSWHPAATLLDPSLPALPLNRSPIPPIRRGFGPNLVRQEPIWSPKAIHASLLGVGSTQGGGQPLLEATGIEPAAPNFWRARSNQ
jgi:hypothetical protein